MFYYQVICSITKLSFQLKRTHRFTQGNRVAGMGSVLDTALDRRTRLPWKKKEEEEEEAGPVDRENKGQSKSDQSVHGCGRRRRRERECVCTLSLPQVLVCRSPEVLPSYGVGMCRS
ncbi:hypothetical protein L1049_001612 [Liquidambar formosana]|uniref:Uncharacterized protein n=1 Tax=Liquidambar formosana TaxID=63359 RepID=A0AAP0N7N8_LIQFO